MRFSNAYKIFFPLVALSFFSSCDKDFSELGSDIVGDDHFNFESYTDAIVSANNQATGPVQSNNMPINPLGIYKNPAFGTTTASFVTQLELGTINPTFTTIDNPPSIDSVTLTVPYTSSVTSTNSDGTKIYKLGDVYGANSSRIKLSVYRSGYFLKDIDHDENGELTTQRYYSDQTEVLAAASPNLNNDPLLSQNEQFFFDNSEVTEETLDSHGNVKISKVAPRMELKLDKQYFLDNIINAPAGSLANNSVFKNYFRGIVFKAESFGANEGQLAMLDFTKGKITIKYKQDKSTTTTVNGETTTTVVREDKSLVLNMKGNSVSILSNSDENPLYVSAISQPPTTAGAPWLYLHGGQGAVATIDLFGADDPADSDDIPEQLEEIKANGWFINEANLTFNIDQGAMQNASIIEPERIYLYDINNKRPLVDYIFDNSSSSLGPKYAKTIHGGIIERETGTDGRGIRYKIRLTNYIRDLIDKDSTNVRLGLSVTENIGISSMNKLKNTNTELNNFVPQASVMSPVGTVLYGPNIDPSSANYDKRLRLEIFYTKPN
ncbi:MAG: DUF4270 domain-containing protein [Flavobacterium sp.]|nr:MAG: DUF4270 domain-containing protein [Flavobacterium sp.]